MFCFGFRLGFRDASCTGEALPLWVPNTNTDPVAEERLKMQVPGPRLLRVDPLSLGLALRRDTVETLAQSDGVLRDILGLL